MTTRQWLVLLLLGAFGYGALAYLFPRFDPAAKWQYQLDRNQLLTQAQAFAAEQGIDVSTWTRSLQSSRERHHERYLRDHLPDALTAAFLSPLTTQISFRDPKTNESVRLDYTAQGQLLAFRRIGAKPSDAEKPVPPNKDIAEAAIAKLLGAYSQQFASRSETETEKGSRKYVWSHVSPTDTGLKVEAEAPGHRRDVSEVGSQNHAAATLCTGANPS